MLIKPSASKRRRCCAGLNHGDRRFRFDGCPANGLRRLALILAHLIVESAARDAENLRAATQVVTCRSQNPLDI